MLRIGKNPKDSGKAEVSGEKQAEGSEPIATEIDTGGYSVKMLVDSTGKPFHVYNLMGQEAKEYYEAAERARASEIYVQGSPAPEDEVILSIPHREFERLTTKTNEVLAEAALAQERINKDQEEIEQLKTATRAMLARLRAA